MLMNALIKITGSLKDKGHCIVAYCPEFDVYSQGYTKEEARKNLKEAVQLFLEEAGRMGTLEQILSDPPRPLRSHAGAWERERFPKSSRLWKSLMR